MCDFVDEVPDDIFRRLTHAGQVAFEPVNPTTGVKTRLKAQYYVMAMHSMSLADALTLFKVCVCAAVLVCCSLVLLVCVVMVDVGVGVVAAWCYCSVCVRTVIGLAMAYLPFFPCHACALVLFVLYQVGEPRPLPFLVKVLHDVGRGLLSVRANRVLHMDLKAANVVLDWAGPDSRYALPHMELGPLQWGEGVPVDGCRFPCLSK